MWQTFKARLREYLLAETRARKRSGEKSRIGFLEHSIQEHVDKAHERGPSPAGTDQLRKHHTILKEELRRVKPAGGFKALQRVLSEELST